GELDHSFGRLHLTRISIPIVLCFANGPLATDFVANFAIFLIVSSGSPWRDRLQPALNIDKALLPHDRSLHSPMTACGTELDSRRVGERYFSRSPSAIRPSAC